MKRFVISTSLVLVASLSACGSKMPPPAADAAPTSKTEADTAPAVAPDAAAQAEPDAAPAGEVAGAALAAVDVAEAAVSPAVVECKAIAEKAFVAAKPNLAKLGFVPTPEQEAAAKNDQGFIDACAALPDDKRKCLADSDNPAAAIDSCKVNEPSRTVWAHDYESAIELAKPAPLTEDEVKAALAWIEGTWVSNWEGAQEITRWVVGKDGAVTSAEVTRRGEPAPTANVPESVAFPEAGRLSVRWKGSTTDQKLSFLKEGDDVFYASTNLLYDAYAFEADKPFIAKTDRDFIVFSGGTCEVIFGTGVLVPATCAFKDAGKVKTFEAEYTRPGASRPSKSIHYVSGKHLVSENLYSSGRFVRQK